MTALKRILSQSPLIIISRTGTSILSETNPGTGYSRYTTCSVVCVSSYGGFDLALAQDSVVLQQVHHLDRQHQSINLDLYHYS